MHILPGGLLACRLLLFQPEVPRSIGCCLLLHVSREYAVYTLALLHSPMLLSRSRCWWRVSRMLSGRGGVFEERDRDCGTSRMSNDRRLSVQALRGFWAAGMAWKGIARAVAVVRSRGRGRWMVLWVRGFQQFQGCGLFFSALLLRDFSPRGGGRISNFARPHFHQTLLFSLLPLYIVLSHCGKVVKE